MTELPIAKRVDARGLECPLPVLRAKLAITEMLSGQLLEVLADDPNTIADLHIFCQRTGHTLVAESANQEQLRFVIRKA